MDLHECLLTNNECYQRGNRMTPHGIMVHSTGANNPNLRRYVQPDDGYLGVNKYGNDWNQYRPADRQVCVHAFIGRLASGMVATYQTLPWDYVGWHGGSIANKSYIGFEICEDDLTGEQYFADVYREATELTAMLCDLYGINPLGDGNVICHAEGFQRGIATNHADVLHWFPKHGKSMDDFRHDVFEIVNGREKNMTRFEIENLVIDKINAILKGDGTSVTEWAKPEMEKAIAKGITDGSRPQGYITREEVAVMLNRISG